MSLGYASAVDAMENKQFLLSTELAYRLALSRPRDGRHAAGQESAQFGIPLPGHRPDQSDVRPRSAGDGPRDSEFLTSVAWRNVRVIHPT